MRKYLEVQIHIHSTSICLQGRSYQLNFFNVSYYAKGKLPVFQICFPITRETCSTYDVTGNTLNPSSSLACQESSREPLEEEKSALRIKEKAPVRKYLHPGRNW